MTELDKIRAEIVERLEKAEFDLEMLQHLRNAAACELMAHDRAVAAMSAPAADSPPTRRSVQLPVMALFGPGQGTWDEEGIVEKTGLPRDAVHKFVLRAALKGMLRRLPTSAPGPNAEYGLPVKAPAEAAQ